MTTSDNCVLHEIAAIVNLPILSDDKSRIFYFYQLETFENGQYLNKAEQYLTQDNFIRHIDPSYYLIKKSDSRDLKIPNHTIDEIDGILLYDHVNNLIQLRKNLVELSFPTLFLSDDSILNDSDQFKNYLSFFINSFRSLIHLDHEYNFLIKAFLQAEFSSLIESASQEVFSKSDSTYRSMLAIFYLSRKFKLNINFENIIFLHNVNRPGYFYELKNFFQADDSNFK